MPVSMSNTRRFPGAGYLTLIKHLPDGTDSQDPKDCYTSGRVVMGVVNTGYSTTQTPLEDENSKFPAANYTTSTKSTLTVGFNTKDPRLQAFLKGATEKTATQVNQWHTNIERTIQASGEPVDSGSIVLKDLEDGTTHQIGEGYPVLVRDDFSNTDYKEVKASPKAGEFAVDRANGTFTFAKEDAGKTVFISCELIGTEGVVYELSADPKVPTFTAILSGLDEDHNEADPRYVTEIYDNVQPSGEINDMPRQRAPGNWTASFETQKPRPGKNTVTTTYSKQLLALNDFAA